MADVLANPYLQSQEFTDTDEPVAAPYLDNAPVAHPGEFVVPQQRSATEADTARTDIEEATRFLTPEELRHVRLETIHAATVGVTGMRAFYQDRHISL